MHFGYFDFFVKKHGDRRVDSAARAGIREKQKRRKGLS